MGKWSSLYKSITVAVAIALTAGAAGCGGGEQNPPETWYRTKEEAIRRGLAQERIPSENVMSVEEIDGETLIFYHKQEAFGAASLTQGERGYRWHRNQPFWGIEASGNQPYPFEPFTVVTESGKSFRGVFGYARDSLIEQMILIGDGAARALPVHKDTGLFYAVLRNPNAQVTIEPFPWPSARPSPF